MRILKVTIYDDTDQRAALAAVSSVISLGRISTTPHGPSYCAIALYESATGEEIRISCTRTVTMDVFRVWTPNVKE